MTTISQVQPRGANRRQLLIAGVLGLIAAMLVIVFLNNAADDGGTVSVATTSVVVAAQPIAAGEKITDAMLTTQDVTASTAAQGAYADTSLVAGQVARYPIERGEQLSPARLVDAPNVKTLSFQIPAGMRGMTIPVEIEKTPAALIAPGDFVDVLISVEVAVLTGREARTPSGDRELKGAATVLQNIQVLSVDRNYIDTGVVYEPSLRGEPPAEKDKVSFVTLAVRPDQAQVLWLAQDNGKLTLVLRPFGDDEVVPLTPELEPLTLTR